MTRRVFVGIAGAVLLAQPVRCFKLRAIAAANMPHRRTIRSSDPQFAEHFSKGGIFEIREYSTGTRLMLFDSLEARDREWARSNMEHNLSRPSVRRDSPISIALYRPA